MRIRWTRAASHDLVAMRAWVGRQDPSSAARAASAILAAVEALTATPGLGRPGRAPDTRELVVWHTPYLIAYRIADAEVFILRVLHSARQWPRKL